MLLIRAEEEKLERRAGYGQSLDLNPGPPHASVSPIFMNCTSCLRSVVPWDELGSGGPLQVRAPLGFGWPKPQVTVR